MLHDLRYAIRALRRSPGFTAAALVCLALGIGANTAIFSLIEAALLRGLPVPHPEQIAIVHSLNNQGDRMNFSYPQFVYLRSNVRSLTPFAHAKVELNLSMDDVLDTPDGELVSDNYFAALEVQPTLGRAFVPGDDAVAIISNRYWRGRFRADPTVVGRTVNLNRLPFTIIGVAPRKFFGVEIGRAPDVFVPVAWRDRLLPGAPILDSTNSFWLDVMARVPPGTGMRQAESEADALYRQANTEQTRELAPDHPLAHFLRATRLVMSEGSKGIGGPRAEFGQPLLILMGIVGMVLLIACANVAALLVARANARRKEVAVRLALGAGRGRLGRQFVTESLALAITGGLLGLIFASWGATALAGFLNQSYLDVSPDPRVLTFTFAVAVGCGLLFGAAPAAQAGRQDIAGTLRNTAPGAGWAHGIDLRTVLVAAQVAISLLLVVGAGLFLRTLVNLRGLDTGIHADNVILLSLNTRLNRYSSERTREFYGQLLERVSALPGVTVASEADAPLLAGAMYLGAVAEGRASDPQKSPPVAIKVVTPRFLETMGIALRAGRDFGPQDRSAAARVAIVNEQFVKEFFDGKNPIGRRIGFELTPDTEVVGVIADTKYRSLRGPVPSTVYVPMEQAKQPPPTRTLHVRSSAPPQRLAAAIQEQARRLDPDLPVSKIETFSSILDARLVRERMIATLSGFFGALALLLVSVGLYGVLAYMVQCRTREIGIRVSLGAAGSSVIWMVMRRAFWVVLAGVAIGAPASFWLSGLLKSLLFGVSPGDLGTIAAAILLLVMVAGLASYLPARRAARVDPMVALRYE